MSAETLLAVNDVVRTFGGIRAVDGVSFDVQRGEVFGIIGPNGAGKTALLNCLNGVYPVQSGEVVFDGNRIEHLAPIASPRSASGERSSRPSTSRTFESSTTSCSDVPPGSPNRCSGAPSRSRSVRRHEEAERQRCFDVLSRLGLAGYVDEHLSSLPYGIGKQVDMARGLAAEPHIMLLDEPTSGVDPA